MSFQIDRSKYIQIAREQGVNASLTALHNDSREWEFDTFEGQAGWQPDQYEILRQVRELSRELWNVNYGSRPIPVEFENDPTQKP